MSSHDEQLNSLQQKLDMKKKGTASYYIVMTSLFLVERERLKQDNTKLSRQGKVTLH